MSNARWITCELSLIAVHNRTTNPLTRVESRLQADHWLTADNRGVIRL